MSINNKIYEGRHNNLKNKFPADFADFYRIFFNQRFSAVSAGDP